MTTFFKKITLSVSMVIMLAGFSLSPLVSLAQGGLVPCGNGEYSYDASDPGAKPPDNSGASDKMCTVTDLFRVVVIVTNFLIAFAGLIAVLMIVRAGVMMITSAGNPTGYGAAKKSMINAIIGFCLTFLAFMLVNTLLSTQLGINIKDGGNIFTNTIDFIKGPQSSTTTPPTSPPPTPKP